MAPLEPPTSGAFQRIGLSATQKPLSEVGRFLVGAGRDCELVDVGHRRPMDIAIEVPPSPLSTVCSHEQWDEIYRQVAGLIAAHRTTLIFVNTRKLAERIRLCGNIARIARQNCRPRPDRPVGRIIPGVVTRTILRVGITRPAAGDTLHQRQEGTACCDQQIGRSPDRHRIRQ